jgi:hypothetical protein
MNEALLMYKQTTFEDLLNVISLQELVVGVTHLDLQDGQTIIQFGQQVCPVNLSVSQENNLEKMTKDTYCPTSQNLLNSASLTESLVNRLKAQLGTAGSMIYKQQWKQKATPLGIAYWAHTASARTIKDKDYTGLLKGSWATPCTIEPDEQPEAKWARHKMINERQKAKGKAGLGTALHLGAQVHLASYPTPAQAAWWPTASTRDHKGGYLGGRIRNGKLSTDTLDVAAQLTGWATTQARDWKGAQGRAYKGQSMDLPAQAQGATQTGYIAETKSTGQLNPALSRWLMGFPKEWCEAAIAAKSLMPTTRKKRVQCD